MYGLPFDGSRGSNFILMLNQISNTMKKYRKYRLIYLTKRDDVLREEITAQFCIKDARRLADYRLATTSHNDLHRIMVRRIYEPKNATR